MQSIPRFTAMSLVQGSFSWHIVYYMQGVLKKKMVYEPWIFSNIYIQTGLRMFVLFLFCFVFASRFYIYLDLQTKARSYRQNNVILKLICNRKNL